MLTNLEMWEIRQLFGISCSAIKIHDKLLYLYVLKMKL